MLGRWCSTALRALLPLPAVRTCSRAMALPPSPSQLIAGYLEEEAVRTYTRCIKVGGMAQEGGGSGRHVRQLARRLGVPACLSLPRGDRGRQAG